MTAPIVIAHIAGVPLEELLPLAYGGGAVWLAARVLGSNRAVVVRRRLRRLRPQRVDRARDLSTGVAPAQSVLDGKTMGKRTSHSSGLERS